MSPVRFRSLLQIFLIGVVLVSVPLLAGTVLTFVYIERLSDDSRSLVVRSLEIGRETEKLIDHIEELSRTAQQYVVVGDEELYNLYTQKHFRLIDTLEWLELLVDKQEAQQVLDDIRVVSEAAFRQIQSLSISPGAEISGDNFDRLVELSDNLRFFSSAAIRNQLDTAARRVETARLTLYWIWIVSSLFMIAFVALFAWVIAKPIRRLDAHIRRLGQGRFDTPIRIEGPADIAELGERLDWLRTRLGEVDLIKERFFREMSHQLKTPLASIREGTDLLRDDPRAMAGERGREVLDLVHNNSIELQRMLDNMLNFSAWRADPGRLYRDRFQLRPVLESVAQRFRASMMTRGLEIGVDCPESLTVEMDREKCRVILDNLISNAVKYSPDNGEITVTAGESRAGVSICVADQGPGVPPAERDRIFELFYLSDTPAGSQNRGTGIGLALVRAYVEAHGGTVTVESEQNSGAQFRVTIPQSQG
ncbi:MAG TPA: HAMP domain-containing sensor histidine kinase [Arenicellales bacterium]|nr:HAMP domain-containing sensor histidine kinase [Arenicellales bacterium]